jgi:hypothetical protein
MIKVIRRGQEREIRDNQLERYLNNGWQQADHKVVAVLKPRVKNTEVTPAVEDASSEQGDNDEANLKENENE